MAVTGRRYYGLKSVEYRVDLQGTTKTALPVRQKYSLAFDKNEIKCPVDDPNVRAMAHYLWNDQNLWWLLLLGNIKAFNPFDLESGMSLRIPSTGKSKREEW